MEIRILVDPLGNEVHLPANIELLERDESWIDNDLSMTISKPALIIQPTKHSRELYHLRSVGWNISILIKSERKSNFWLVTECIHNPASNLIIELINKSGGGVYF